MLVSTVSTVMRYDRPQMALAVDFIVKLTKLKKIVNYNRF